MSTNNLLRVTQTDAVVLDNEIYKILLRLVQNCTTHLSPGSVAQFEPEMHLLVKLLVLNYSILKGGSTFGQKMLIVQYTNMSQIKKILYVVLSSLDYFKHRLESLPKFYDIFNTIMKIETFIRICSFINLSIFLQNGQKPRFIERILCLEQGYSQENVQRQFGSKYMTRELLWNGFIEILVHILPLINYHKIRRIAQHLNPFHKKLIFYSGDSRTFTTRTCCAHCAKAPVLPYHMGCPHIFCYTCLKGNLLADTKYECPVCEYSGMGVYERVTVG